MLRTSLLEIPTSIIISFLLGFVLLLSLGYDPVNIYKIIIFGSIGDPDYLLIRSTPLVLTGLAFSIPFLTGTFNIGGEGQFYIGALLSLLAAYTTKSSLMAIAVGTMAGGILGALIAIIKVYRGINEVVSSIMLNWILYFSILFSITTFLYDPLIPYQSVPVPLDARLGCIQILGERVPLIFLIAVCVAFISYYILYYSRIGYCMRVSGLSPKSARYAGFSPELSVITSMVLGGAMGGLGGSLLVIGHTYTIDTTMSALYGMGFAGIGVGLLGRNNPIGIIFSSIFFSMLVIGGEMAELRAGIPTELADALIGIMVIALSMPYIYRIVYTYIRSRK
jgi:simple sugar transport system permease protein